MARYKVLNASFDPSTGKSTVTIGTTHGQYTGYATMLKEDEAFASSYFGCRLAELRALKKFYLDDYYFYRKMVRYLRKNNELVPVRLSQDLQAAYKNVSLISLTIRENIREHEEWLGKQQKRLDKNK